MPSRKAIGVAALLLLIVAVLVVRGFLFRLGSVLDDTAPTIEAVISYLLLLAAGILTIAVLAIWRYWKWRKQSNRTPHADARDVPAPASDSGARAGGRER